MVVCAIDRPRSAIISTRSRRLTLNRRYQRTHRMMTSRSKWRPSNNSSTLFSLPIADPQPFSRQHSRSDRAVCTRAAPMAAKMRLRSSPLERRVAEAEAEVARRFRDRAMDLLGDRINASPPDINRAIEMRLRSLWARQAEDPAWNATDPVRTILLACGEIAPDLVASVVAELGIELNPKIGTGT